LLIAIRNNDLVNYKNGYRRCTMLHCFLEIFTYLQETKPKVVEC
jgi:hypothetical protein